MTRFLVYRTQTGAEMRPAVRDAMNAARRAGDEAADRGRCRQSAASYREAASLAVRAGCGIVVVNGCVCDAEWQDRLQNAADASDRMLAEAQALLPKKSCGT